MNGGPVPDRSIGEHHLLDAICRIRVELIVDLAFLPRVQSLEVKMVSAATKLHLPHIEVGQVERIDIGGAAIVADLVLAIARCIAIGVAAAALVLEIVVAARPDASAP